MPNGYFSPDTQILLANGSYKNITLIAVGDMILNMHIKPVKVVQIHTKDVRPMCVIKYPNWYTPIYCTRNSQILTIIKYDKTIWKKIDELNNDDNFCTAGEIYMYLPNIFDTQEIMPSYEIGYIFGLYAGYGNIVNDQIVFCFGPNTELVSELSILLHNEFKVDISIEKDESCYKLYVNSDKLYSILSEFKNRISRNIPRKYWILHMEYIRGLFDGLVEFDPESNNCRYVTVSKSMAEVFTWICSVMGLQFENNTQIINTTPICSNCPTNNTMLQLYSLFTITNSPLEPTGDSQEYRLRITDLDTPQQAWSISVDCPTNSFIANNTIVRAIPSKRELDSDNDF